MKLATKRIISIIASLVILLLASWFVTVSYLTKHNENACKEMVKSDAMYSQSDHGILQSVLDNYSLRNNDVGLQATVIFPDNSIWRGVSGYAIREEKCALTHTDHLYIGSITKLYTASLVMKQVDEKTLSINDTLDKWFNFSYADQISVKMLLNHTSGIPNFTDNPSFTVQLFAFPWKNWKTNEIISYFENRPLEFSPGSQHEYSNSNYLLLGIILEKTSGKTYQTLLQEGITSKLVLSDTYYNEIPENIIIANGYDKDILHLGVRNITGFRTSLTSGSTTAGRILSTSYDVATFTHALLNGYIVTNNSLSQMKIFVDAPDEEVPSRKGYGLGTRYLIIDGEDLIGHTGTLPGYSGIAMHNENKNYTIVILSNLSNINQEKLLEEIQQVVLDELMNK